MSLRDLFLTGVALLFLLPLWLLPWRVATRVGRFYGRVAYGFLGESRRAGLINLRRAYGPSMDLTRANDAVRTVFENLAQSLVEAIQVGKRMRRGEDLGSLYALEDPALSARLLADPRPKIFVTAHLGSWEVAMMILQRTIGGGAGIARRVDNRWLDRLVKRVRLDDPSQWIEKKGAASVALERLRAGESVAMLIDENGGPRGPFVEFFGRPASTRKTPAVLSLATGAPIVIGAVVRSDGGFVFRLAMIDPVAEGLRGADAVVSITARINRQLEAWIREVPLQWRWIHWRWKARPDGTTERYTRKEVEDLFALDSRVETATS